MEILRISKVNTFLVGIMMMAILLCCSSQVQAAQEGDYNYTVTDNKATITGYTGDGGVVTIPSTLGGYPVASIGEYAFVDCSNLTGISFPQGLTSIGDYAFNYCKGLTSISIPQGITSIGDGAFINCTGLTSFTVAVNNLNYSSINGILFNKVGDILIACPGAVTTISIPIGVTSIGRSAFYGCTGLTSINIPQGVASIGYNAFSGCTGLTSITVAVNNLNYSSIEGVLFNKEGTILIRFPEGLTTISIPQGVTSINEGAFSSKGLTSISIPQGVTNVGLFAFFGCSGLESITFNSATTTIYDSESTIPATTKIIGYDPSTAKTFATTYNRTFEVIGTTSTLQTIAITTPATKLSYSVGDPLDISELEVTGTYSNGGTKVETITAANVTGFDSSSPATSQTLTITIGGKSTTYDIEIKAASDVVLNSIAITTPATKLIYTVGDTLDITGIVVTGTYDDSSNKVETVTAANITGFDSAVATEDQVLTITIGAKTTTIRGYY